MHVFIGHLIVACTNTSRPEQFTLSDESTVATILPSACHWHRIKLHESACALYRSLRDFISACLTLYRLMKSHGLLLRSFRLFSKARVDINPVSPAHRRFRYFSRLRCITSFHRKFGSESAYPLDSVPGSVLTAKIALTRGLKRPRALTPWARLTLTSRTVFALRMPSSAIDKPQCDIDNECQFTSSRP